MTYVLARIMNILANKIEERKVRKVLEIIELRSVIKNREQLIILIENLLDNEFNKPNMEIKIYTHSTFVTDYCINLSYEVEDNLTQESYLGYELSANLRECGLVNHNIWIEEKLRGKNDEK